MEASRPSQYQSERFIRESNVPRVAGRMVRYLFWLDIRPANALAAQTQGRSLKSLLQTAI